MPPCPQLSGSFPSPLSLSLCWGLLLLHGKHPKMGPPNCPGLYSSKWSHFQSQEQARMRTGLILQERRGDVMMQGCHGIGQPQVPAPPHSYPTEKLVLCLDNCRVLSGCHELKRTENGHSSLSLSYSPPAFSIQRAG